MQSSRSRESSIIDSLQILLQEERKASDLTKLPPSVLVIAVARMDELAEQIRQTRDGALYQEHDAISDHLGTIVNLRAKKIAAGVGYGRPQNLMPAEAPYLEALEAATAALMDAWGLTE